MIQLLRYVEDINIYLEFEGSDYTPLKLAVIFQLEDVVKYIILLRDVDLNKPSGKEESTPLHSAVRLKHPKFIEILVRNGAYVEAEDQFDRTSLFYAVKLNDMESVQFLLHYGARLFKEDSQGKTLLHTIFQSEKEVNMELLNLLLKWGCDPNATSSCGSTPLHVLATKNYISNKEKCANLLIRYGAKLNKLDNNGNTVLHKAAEYSYDGNSLSILQLFIKNGADVEKINRRKETFIQVHRLHDPHNLREIIKFITLEEFKGNLDLGYRSSNSLFVEKSLTTLKNSCRNELHTLDASKMKNGNLIPFKLFFVSERAVAKLCKHPYYASVISTFNEKNFPIYGPEIKQRFESGQKRFKAESACFQFLKEASRGVLQYRSILKVIKFLKTEDMERIEAFMSAYVVPTFTQRITTLFRKLIRLF